MTNQEKKFADECVFMYFNSDETSLRTNAIIAAKYAGYEIPREVTKADLIVNSLLEKVEVKDYIAEQIHTYKAKFDSSQRRKFWDVITAMTLGDPCDWTHYGRIDPRF